jgi:hypothetical protein
MLEVPVLRRMEQTPYSFEVHPDLPMKYESSNEALKDIGEGLGYEKLPTHYNFRRWVANEVNRKFSYGPVYSLFILSLVPCFLL